MLVLGAGQRAGEEGAIAVEGAAGLDVDHAADGVGVLVGRHRLDHLDAAGQRGGHDVQRYGPVAIADGCDDAAVDGGAVVGARQPADDREARLALVLLHRDAGDTPERGGGVVVRQGADVVRRDPVADHEGLALELDRLLLGRTLAGDDELADFRG